MIQLQLDFDGAVYQKQFDQARLTGQLLDIFDLMRDGKWRTLSEIEQSTGHPSASISAQLRHLRKERFGNHTIEKEPRGDRENGLWQYRLLVNRSYNSPNANS